MTKTELKRLNKEYVGKELTLLEFDNTMQNEFEGESLFDSRNSDCLATVIEGEMTSFSYGNTYMLEGQGDCVNVWFTVLKEGNLESEFDTIVKIEEISEI